MIMKSLAPAVAFVVLITTDVFPSSVNAFAYDENDFLYADHDENFPVIEFFPETEGALSRGDYRDSTAPKMVEFYNPYCGACQAYKPTYLKLAKDLRKRVGESLEVYAVSCVAHKDLCDELGMDAVPTVALLKKGSTELRELKVEEKHPNFILPYLFPGQFASTFDLSRTLMESPDDNEEEGNSKDNDKDGNEEGENEDGDEEGEDEDGNEEGEDDEDNSNNSKDENDNEAEEEEEEEGVVLEGSLGREKPKKAEVEDKNDSVDEDEELRDGSLGRDNPEGGEDEDESEDEEGVNQGGSAPEDSEEGKDGGSAGGEAGEDGDNEEEEPMREGSLGRPRPILSDKRNEEKATSDEDGEDEDEEKIDSAPEDSKEDEGGPDGMEEANREWLQYMAKAESDNHQHIGMRAAPLGQPRNQIMPGAGAILKGDLENRMDRYKEAILKQRKAGMGLFRRGGEAVTKAEHLDKASGATTTMKANTPGTPEYEARQKKVQEHIAKLMKKKGLRTAFPKNPAEQVFSAGAGGASRIDLPANHKPLLPFKKELDKPKTLHSLAGKIPVAKRFMVLSHEEELILDASLSFMTSLKAGLFENSDPLSKSKKRAFQSWLDLLRVSLPPEWGLHEVIMDLDNNIDFIAQSEATLHKFLDKHKLPRTEWSHSCTRDKSQTGFNCGFWKLLHIVTVGIAEQRGGLNLVEGNLVSQQARTFSPHEAAEVMKEFIRNFFPCPQCRNHFVATYDDCSNNRRCARLTDSIHDASNADFLELAKWLWEVHNDVNVRLLKERNPKKTITIHEELEVLYPSLRACASCFQEDGGYDEDHVFLYLEKEYWPGAEIDHNADRLFKFHDVEQIEFAYSWAILVVSVLVIYRCRARCCGVFPNKKVRSD